MRAYLRQLTGESAIYGLSGAAAALVSLFLVPVYTRVFSRAEYGVIELVITTMNLLTIIAVLALDNSAHRWFWNTEDEEDRRSTIATWAWTNLTTTTLIALGIIAFAPQLGALISGNAAHAPLYRLAALTLPLGALGLVTSGWLRMQRRPWPAVSFVVGTNLLTVALTILLVLGLRQGMLGVFWAQALGSGGVTLAGALILGRAIHPRYFRRARLNEMLRFALPLLPAAFAGWAVLAGGRYFVQAFGNTADVGLFSIGARISTVALLVTTAFQAAWGPFAMSIHQRPEARQVYAGVLLYYVWAMGFVAAALALFGREILQVLTTPQYVAAWPVIGVLAFSYVFIGLKFIASIGLQIVKDTRPIGLAVTVSGLVFLGLGLLLVPALGIQGAALATLLSQALIPLYLFWRSQQLYPVPYRFGRAALILLLFAQAALFGTMLLPPIGVWLEAGIKLGWLLAAAACGYLLARGAGARTTTRN